MQRVVPDGCADVVWRAEGRLVVAGPATREALAALPAGSTTVGVRFGPGAAAGVLGLPLEELRDATVPLTELWGPEQARALADALAGAAGDPAAQVALLERAVLARRADAAPRDRLVAAAATRLGGRGEIPSVSVLAAGLGVSERQLLRRFRVAVGYGPKTLARVLRFQRFLAAAWGEGGAAASASAADPASGAGSARRIDLARLAFDAGYADQAHLTRECRTLAGVPPRELLHG